MYVYVYTVLYTYTYVVRVLYSSTDREWYNNTSFYLFVAANTNTNKL